MTLEDFGIELAAWIDSGDEDGRTFEQVVDLCPDPTVQTALLEWGEDDDDHRIIEDVVPVDVPIRRIQVVMKW